MTAQEKVRRDYMISVYQGGEVPPTIRVEFVPRGLQTARIPGHPPQQVPRFLVSARLEGDEVALTWEVPPSDAYQRDVPDLEDEARVRLVKRVQWLDRLEDLIEKVDGWAQSLGWATRRVRKELQDSEIGSYPTRALHLQDDTVRVLLEPIGSSTPDSEGVVDLYLLPGYDDIASLYFYDGRWHLHYLPHKKPLAGNIREAESRPLSKASLRAVLDAMKQHVS